MVRKTASSLLSVPPQSEHSLKPLYQPHFSPVWTMRPELQKHKKTHSCYAAKLRGRQQTKPVRLKTFTWFSPPARPAEKQECKQKKTARRGRAPTWREFAGVGEDREVEGGREAVPFSSDCLHHQRGIPGTQPSRPPGHSATSSLMLSVCGCSVDTEGL